MVAISKLVNNGLLLVGQSVYQDVALPQQAAVEQYNILHFLGGSAPYLQRSGHGISTDIPDQCTLEQVQLFSRHGERYPTQNAGKKISDLQNKLTSYNGTLKGDLLFLTDYQSFIPNDEFFAYETTPSNSQSPYAGTTNAMKHGAMFRAKYNSLYSLNATLPVFTSNSNRCYQTLNYFARGFLGDKYSNDTVEYVIVDEDPSMGFNSLTPRYGCAPYNTDAADDAAAAISNQYNTTYLKTILERFNKANKGLNVTKSDVLTLFSWCAYELNVKGASPVCDLFSNEEFIKYSYGNDLSNYYANGPGNNYTAAIGSTLLNASLALLKDESAENKVWLSFSHDTDIEIYHAALGLIVSDNLLPTDHIPFPNPYEHAQIVPQSARVYTEKYSCKGESYVRYIINDAVVPISSCATGPGFSCPIADFEEHLSERIAKADIRTTCQVPSNQSTTADFYWNYKTTKYDAPLGRF